MNKLSNYIIIALMAFAMGAVSHLQSQVIYITPSGAGLMNGSSWANAMNGNGPGLTGYTRLADTLRHAVSGSSFWVAEGTYLVCTDNDREKSFELRQNVNLYGGFQGTETNVDQRNISLHPTIFSGNIGIQTDSTDNTKIILKTISTPWTNYSLTDGIDFFQAFNNVYNAIGTGVFNDGLLNVKNCNFTNNYSNGGGGGIRNTKIIKIEKCLFYNNRAYEGGGIYNKYTTGDAVITSSKFSNNNGGSRGGGISNCGVSKIINTLIVNNYASLGGGISGYSNNDYNSVNTKIYNTTIVNNSGNNVYIDRGKATIINSIIWGGSLTLNHSPITDFRYSTIQDYTGNPTVNNLDPLLVNPTSGSGVTFNGLNGNWSLRWCSPLFNLGADSLIPSGITTDITGNPRVLYSAVDLGAYELDTTGLIPNVVGFLNDRIYVTDSTSYNGNGSAWSNAIAGNAESCKYPGQTLLYEAMKDATTGTEIWIKQGSYKSSLANNRNHSFTVGNGVKVYGGFSGAETALAQRNPSTNPTIFSGNIGDSFVETDNSYHVMHINPGGISYSDSALIDGVTIEKGYANGASMASAGGGILVNSNTKFQMTNIDIKNNKAQGSGGGIRISPQAKITVTNCRIVNNTMIVVSNGSPAGCGIYNEGKLVVNNGFIKYNNNATTGSGIYNVDSLVLYNCNVDSNFASTTNTAKAGGILNAGSCKISGGTVKWNKAYNSAGGFWNKSGATLNVSGSSFSGNSCNGNTGSALLNDGTAAIKGSTITNNAGGGIFNNTGASCEIFQSTIAYNITTGASNSGFLGIEGSLITNNQASGSGGGLYNPTIVKSCIITNNNGGVWIGAGNQGIFNSTIMNNSGTGISASGITGIVKNTIVYGNASQLTGTFNPFRSCVQGLNPDTTNISDNPLIAGPSTGIGVAFNGLTANWNLQPCSPCVNRGNNAFLSPSDTLDAGGNPRVMFGTVDIGALELQTTPMDLVDYSTGIVYVSDSSVQTGSGNSWGNSVSGNASSCRYPGYTMLYQAMRDAPPNCQVWVKKGIYPVTLDADRNKSFVLLPKTRLYGGFSGNETSLNQRDITANPTEITGNIGALNDSLDNSFHIAYTPSFSTPWNDTAMLNGITLSDAVNVGNGGGLVVNPNTKIKLVHCKVTKNAGTTFAAGISNHGNLILNNTEVSYNKVNVMSAQYSDLWGGAGIYNFTDGTLDMDSSTIAGNTTTVNIHGGGIYQRGKAIIKNSDLDGNIAGRDGGGIYSRAPIKLFNCSLTNNRASYHGGAIYTTDSLNVDQSILRYNGAHSTPGIFTTGFGMITNSEISHNFVTGQGGSGGGIQSLGKMKVINCDIHANNTNGITVTITGGLFNIVVIVTGADGGGILHSGDSLFVEDCRIYGNRAAGGGAIAVRGGYASIRNSFLTNNFSAYGAACYNEKNLELRNCVIANNMSYSEGILKNVGASSTSVINTTLTNNTRYSSQQTNALLFHGGSQNLTPTHFKLSNCIVKNSFGLTGYYTGATGTDTINYSCVLGGFSGTGNLNTEPIFVNPTPGNDTIYSAIHANWSLSACSPCINAGSDSLTTDSLDLAGNIRKYNTVDMGALELKYDTSVTALWSSNVAETAATIHWSRSVKPCETVVFIKDTVAGSPIPVPGAVYNADTLFGSGSNLAGWYCLYKGMDSTVNVSGLTSATTYRVAVFNLILDSIYDVPALMNFTTPGSLPVNKFVINDTIGNGEWACYNASNSIVVAGNGTFYKVDGGGSVTLIAGQNIRLLPGTIVDHGGFLFAQIRPNGPWCYETKSATVNLEPEPLNLEPGTLNPVSPDVFRVKVWPNPVSDMLNVSWESNGVMEQTSVELCNYFGARLFTSNVEGNNNMVLSLKNLPPGIYLLKVSQGNNSGVVKVIRN